VYPPAAFSLLLARWRSITEGGAQGASRPQPAAIFRLTPLCGFENGAAVRYNHLV
jgi:hypothetical protein